MGLTRKQWLMMIVLVFGSFITVLNQTLVTPAIPSIMEEMSVDAATAQWLTTGFTLVNAIMIPITAYFQDRFSTRSLFIVSMSLFGLGSLLCGICPNFISLLIGRLVQAGGAGILMPMTMTVLILMFPIERRGSAMGVFGLVIAFAPAVGPTVAGFVIDTFDWHVMFFGVTGLSIIVLIMSFFLMQNVSPGSKDHAKLDILSLVLSTLGFGLMLYGFSAFGSSAPLWLSLSTMVIGAIGVVWFFRRQTKLEHPMLRVEVLKNQRFLIGTIIGMLVQGALLAAGILMPIYVQTLLGQPATVSGLLILPGALLMGIMNPIAGKLFDKHGPRKLAITGMSLLTASTVVFAMLTLETSLIFLTVVYAIRMVAMTLVNMPITTWGMNALDNKLMNHGTSVNNTLRQVAGSLSTAIIISASTIVQGAATPIIGEVDGTLLGINVAFGICVILCLIGTILVIVKVKDAPAKSKAATTETVPAEIDETAEKNLLQSIMKHDVFTIPQNATVADAMKLFTENHISAAPIVNESGEPVGFLSDGDILKQLSPRGGSLIDPVVMIMNSVKDHRTYDERLEHLMTVNVKDIGARSTISVSHDADLPEVCRVLSDHHLKKVPVMRDGKIIGIINRSDITQYSMNAYLQGRESLASALPEDEPIVLEVEDADCATDIKNIPVQNSEKTDNK